MDPLHLGGEEWVAMDDSATLYEAGKEDHVVAEAKQRITRQRQRDVELRLVDETGKPVADRSVEIEQLTHAFEFGCNTWHLDTLYREGRFDQDRGRYWKLRFRELFNTASVQCYWTERPRNDGPKTEDLQGEPQYEGFAAIVDWARAHGMRAKGHPLFWSIPKCVPEWVKRYDYDTQMKFVEVRVRSLVARFKGRVTSWDAVNEAIWEPAFKNLPNRDWPHIEPISDIADYIEPVLRWARDEDPDACYVINDYGMEQDKPGSQVADSKGNKVTASMQRKRFIQIMEELQQRGCAPDAMGMQAHTGGWLPHATQLRIYDEMQQVGLPVHITEFWAHTRSMIDEGMPEQEAHELQARYVCDYLTVAYSHPVLESFHFWGFNGVKWYDEHSSSHDLLPVYTAVHDLLHNQWKTRATLKTNADGVLKFRGFFGNYTLRHELSKGTKAGKAFTVDPTAGIPLTLTLKSGLLR